MPVVVRAAELALDGSALPAGPRRLRRDGEAESERGLANASLVLLGRPAARAGATHELALRVERQAAGVDDDPLVGRVEAPVVAAGLGAVGEVARAHAPEHR